MNKLFLIFIIDSLIPAIPIFNFYTLVAIIIGLIISYLLRKYIKHVYFISIIILVNKLIKISFYRLL